MLTPGVGAGVLHVSVQAAACDGEAGSGEAAEHAACHLYQQDWGIPLELSGPAAAPDAEGAQDDLVLDLRGV